jgi:hypothetical protein
MPHTNQQQVPSVADRRFMGWWIEERPTRHDAWTRHEVFAPDGITSHGSFGAAQEAEAYVEGVVDGIVDQWLPHTSPAIFEAIEARLAEKLT